MKRLVLYAICLTISISLGCKKDNKKTYPVSNESMINFVQGILSFKNRNLDGSLKEQEFKTKLSTQPDSLGVFPLTASFSKSGVATHDISINFKVDNAKLDSINLAQRIIGNALYSKIPDDAISFVKSSATIKKGEFSSGHDAFFTISAKKIKANTLYLIPVTMATSDSKFRVDPRYRTAYFVIRAIDPYKWEVIDFNSQETVGEGVVNGRASCVVDGDILTFWHTKWFGGEDPMPHWITIDMKIEKMLKGINLVNRQNRDGGFPKNFNIEVSKDGKTWISAGSFVGVKGNMPTPYSFSSPISCRYFRVNITSAAGNTAFTFLAEITELY
ncbi:MAG: discoidin domain-containing protein [Sphingobacteriaceae bacterium]|nr:discoidin domain-containing protein [Sphingobacteriaceae bacterium]